jgi:DNA-binding NarL/FixJ family response regulator
LKEGESGLAIRAMTIPQSVLIVDDEARVRAFMKLMLGQLGMRSVFEAANAEEARTLFAAHAPELVTLDVNMPGGGGLGLLEEFRTADDEVLIVMFSADAQSGTVKSAVEAGADGFIRKDAAREQILAELREILAN